MGLALVAALWYTPASSASDPLEIPRDDWCNLFLSVIAIQYDGLDYPEAWSTASMERGESNEAIEACESALAAFEDQLPVTPEGWLVAEAQAPLSYLVNTWSGETSMDTAAFRLVTGSFRAEISAEAGDGPCSHISHLSPTEGFGFEASASFFLDAGEEDSVTTYIHGLDGGRYYWDISSSCDWSIRLYRD